MLGLSWALMSRDRHIFAPEMALLVPRRACWLTRLCAGAGAADQRLQVLQDDGRQRALAHVGISSAAAAPDGKPWGERIDALVCDWATTYKTVLTQSHKKVRAHSIHCIGADDET